jgi:tetratricopeptide (TPR) repeat protein
MWRKDYANQNRTSWVVHEGDLHMSKTRLVLGALFLFLVLSVSVFSQERYDTDLGITHYSIELKPDFETNSLDLVAALRIRNFSDKTYDKAEMLCGKSGNHDDWEVEVEGVWHVDRTGRQPAALTVKAIKDPFEGKEEWPLYEISFLRPLSPNHETSLEFHYRLKGKKPDDGFPLHRDRKTELYLISDFSWLPTIYVVYKTGQFQNTYRPAWEMKMQYPAGFVGVADGERVHQEEKNGIITENWRSLNRNFPQVFVGLYETWIEKAGDFSVAVYAPREMSVSGPMRTAFSQAARTFGFFSGLFGELESRTFTVMFSATEWGGHSLSLGTVLSCRYLDLPSPALILDTLFHEMAHSWWGLSVSSHGEGSKFLREALAQFSSFWALQNLKGASYLDCLIRHQKMNCFNYYLAREGIDKQFPLIEQEGFDWQQIIAANYRKGPLIVNQLRLELGDKIFFKAMGTFARRFKGKTADIHDFIRVFDETSGRDLTPMFRDLCWSTGYASYKMTGLRSVAAKGKYETLVKIRNDGDIGVSCPLLLKTKSGVQREMIRVPGRSERGYVYSTSAEVMDAVIDPEQTAFQYDAAQKYRLFLNVDEAYFNDRVGENWFVFNVSYAQYIAGQYDKAAATISRQIQLTMDKWKAKSGKELLKTLQAFSEKAGFPLAPLYAAYIFARGEYYYALGDDRRAEEDVKAALPVMAGYLCESSSASSHAYAATGILPQTHTPKDMEILIQRLTGRPVGFDEGLSQDELKQKVREWQTWWESEGQNQALHWDVLRQKKS